MTANAQSAPLNKGDFTKTTLPIGWLLFTLLAIVTMGVRRGGKRSFDPPPGNWDEEGKFSRKRLFRLVGLILAMTVYWPI